MGIEEEEVQAKIYVMYSKNSRKLLKSQEKVAHSGTGSLQDTKHT
jgi:hypothetical protein